MTVYSSISANPHRLERALFWLRWLLLLGAALLVLLAEESVVPDGSLERSHLVLALGVAIAGNLLVGVLTLVPVVSAGVLGVMALVLDSVITALLVWAYDGAALPLLLLGTLAVLTAAFRFHWRGVGLALVLLSIGTGLAAVQVGDVDQDLASNLGLSLAALAIFGGLGVVLRADSASPGSTGSSLASRQSEAQRLRIIRERARAIFEMANTLSATLDHQRVLETAQMIGTLSLRDDLGPDVRLTSAVLLFQGSDNRLRVVTARGLTRTDEQVAVTGQRGVLGLALKQSTPVFAGDAVRDPELRYFAGFQDSKSVLAIPLRAGFDNFGVMVFGCDQSNAFTDEHVEMMTAIGTQSTISLQNAVLYQNLLHEKEKIVEVEEGARKKLARDLHDGPTQSVAAIAMRVNFIRRLIERQPQQAVEELWKVEELARRTTKEIRHMLFTMRPLVLETKGLIAALQQLAEKMQDTHDTRVTLRGQPDVEQYLDTNQQGVLFYIIEEAVNNARKHSHAEEIVVRLYRREHFAVIEIEDNGVGFDVSAVDSNYERRGSLGMVNMRERAELIEGTLRIQSAKGHGTKISVLVALQSAAGLPPGEVSSAPLLNLQSQRSGAQAPAAAMDTAPTSPLPPDLREPRLSPGDSQPQPPARSSQVRPPAMDPQESEPRRPSQIKRPPSLMQRPQVTYDTQPVEQSSPSEQE